MASCGSAPSVLNSATAGEIKLVSPLSGGPAKTTDEQNVKSMRTAVLILDHSGKLLYTGNLSERLCIGDLQNLMRSELCLPLRAECHFLDKRSGYRKRALHNETLEDFEEEIDDVFGEFDHQVQNELRNKSGMCTVAVFRVVTRWCVCDTTETSLGSAAESAAGGKPDAATGAAQPEPPSSSARTG